MVQALGAPATFVTFSAADLQWPDLHRFIPEMLSTAPRDKEGEQTRLQLYRRNLNKNLYIAACWFYIRYPQPLRDVPDVVRRRGKRFLKFAPVRNDILLNPINAVMVMGWKANIDLTPCTTVTEVLAYAAKYASKAEKQSASYEELIDRALKSIPIDTPSPIL
ncbi:MAG: hypothetical protein Q9160_007542 [Pyrenula sp. 1 TL-2023]